MGVKEGKSFIFGISCNLWLKTLFVLFTFTTLAREITEPFGKIRRRINYLRENVLYYWLHGYIQPSYLSSGLIITYFSILMWWDEKFFFCHSKELFWWFIQWKGAPSLSNQVGRIKIFSKYLGSTRCNKGIP